MLIALLVIGLLILYYLETCLFSKVWDKGLSLDLKFGEEFLFCGKTGHLYETLTNDKLLPMIAVSVRLAVSRFLIFNGHSESNAGVSDMSYKRDVFTLMPRQQIRRTLTFVVTRRGCYRVNSADLKAFDYLFAKSYFKSCKAQTQVYVYPSQLDISRVQILNQALSGTILKQNALNPDPFAFSSIRNYEPGDNIRYMNWKATGKMDRYMVNRYDATTELSVMLYLDLEDNYIRKSDALIEESIRIAASLISLCLDKKLTVSLVSNAGDRIDIAEGNNVSLGNRRKLKPLYMTSEGDHTNIHLWLRKLACLDADSAGKPISDLIVRYPAPANAVTVLISKNITEGNTAAFAAGQAAGSQALWICPHGLYGSNPTVNDRRITLLPWKVTE